MREVKVSDDGVDVSGSSGLDVEGGDVLFAGLSVQDAEC